MEIQVFFDLSQLPQAFFFHQKQHSQEIQAFFDLSQLPQALFFPRKPVLEISLVDKGSDWVDKGVGLG